MHHQPVETHPTPPDAARHHWHELEVHNASFLVDRLGADCGDLQAVRELTVNALQAIAALGPGSTGRIVWDLDWPRFDASGGRNRKLSVIDTGVGMTADEMRFYINHLSASSRPQGSAQNFGVGAKIAAGSRNPHGLEYRSWKNGEGALVCFKRGPDGRWGLAPQPQAEGGRDFWRPLAEHDKPWALRGSDHGTQVVLLGNSHRHDTTRPPSSVTEARRTWITRYLNGRFATLPDHIELLVRELRPSSSLQDAGPLRRIHGQRHHLQQQAIAAGTLELSDALCHWWLLHDDHRRRRREAGVWVSTGHAAALYQDELYDVIAPTRGGYQRLQDFGVRFGYERVVLYAEPLADHERVVPNTARSLLLLDHDPLPWHRWGSEFAQRMPTEILKLQERVAADDRLPRAAAIRVRLQHQIALYSLSRYRPPATLTPDAGNTHPWATRPGLANPSTPPICSKPPSRDDSDSVETNTTHSPHVRLTTSATDEHAEHLIDLELPDVAWISATDGSRAPGDLEDQAARYQPERHQLTINADFRAFRDMTARWAREYDGVPGARAIAEALVREWFEQALVEVVLSARRSNWAHDRLEQLVSPASLTAAVLPRYLIDQQIHKRLAQRLGPRSTH